MLPMYAQMGVQAFGAASNHFVSKTQAKMQRDMQEHRNTMLAISSSLRQNAVTNQEVEVRRQTVQAAEQISIASMTDKGNAEVAAAASGVAGNSVQRTMAGLERSALRANFARIENAQSAMSALGNERTNINLQQIYGEGTQIFQSPSVGMSLLGLGTSLINTYNANQPSP